MSNASSLVGFRLQQRRRRMLKSAVSVPTSTLNQSTTKAGGKVNSAAALAEFLLGVEVGRGAADFTPSQAQRPTCNSRLLILTLSYTLCTPFYFDVEMNMQGFLCHLCFSLFY